MKCRCKAVVLAGWRKGHRCLAAATSAGLYCDKHAINPNTVAWSLAEKTRQDAVDLSIKKAKAKDCLAYRQGRKYKQVNGWSTDEWGNYIPFTPEQP